MAFPLQPLRFFCERRLSIIESVPEFLTPLKTLTASSSAQHPCPELDHLDTKYGLRLNFKNGQITTVHIVPTPSQPVIDPPTTKPHTTNKVLLPPQSPKPCYSYRLFPDWQTSYLWYDTPSAEGHVHVDEDDISSRYPALAGYYFAWQEAYESAFKKQGCHLGVPAEVFPDAHDRAAWEVEGCLIACWLALRGDVEKVKYQPTKKAYLLKKHEVGDVLKGFLKDVDVGLGK